MSVVEPGASGANLVSRAMALLTRPTPTWEEIEREPATIGGLYTGYVMILSAIPPIATLIGTFFLGFLLGPVWLIGQAIISYVLGLVGVFVLALVIENLAPSFGGAKDRIQAFKVAAYSSTAAWVAGIAMIIPFIGWVGALAGAVYSLVLLYKGLPLLMKVEQEKRTGFFVVVLVVAIVVNVLIAAVVGSVTAAATLGGLAGPRVIGSQTVNVPGAGKVNLGELEAKAKQAEAIAKQLEAGGTVAVADPEALKGYLPASVAGFTRSEVSASSGGIGGLQGSGAEGVYTKGEGRIRLQVTDIGAAGALAGMASAFNVNSSNETSTGYEKVGKVGGRLTQESYDRASRHGEYSVLVADRFMIAAEGENVSMDELKAAVNAVPIAPLEGLAKAS